MTSDEFETWINNTEINTGINDEKLLSIVLEYYLNNSWLNSSEKEEIRKLLNYHKNINIIRVYLLSVEDPADRAFLALKYSEYIN